MANPEHLKILKQGVEVWNKWREESAQQVKPDLRGANFGILKLSGYDLSDADLSYSVYTKGTLLSCKLVNANFFHANFRETVATQSDFTHANLREADFSQVSASQTILDNANMEDANLFESNLIYSSLRNTHLLSTNFTGADLYGADLSGAVLGGTNLINVGLSEAKNLEDCEHYWYSFIDHRTITKSTTLPLVFLRGCGVPDSLIEYFPSLLNDPIQFYSCFISYSSKDQEFAERLHSDLQDNGVRCWYAPEDLRIGEKIRHGIDEAIRIHDKLLLILSENSIGSDWVEKEVETAFEQERQLKKTALFPIRLDESVMSTKQAWAADIRRTRQIGNFIDWKNHDSYKKSFERLLRDLKAGETYDES